METVAIFIGVFALAVFGGSAWFSRNAPGPLLLALGGLSFTLAWLIHEGAFN